MIKPLYCVYRFLYDKGLMPTIISFLLILVVLRMSSRSIGTTIRFIPKIFKVVGDQIRKYQFLINLYNNLSETIYNIWEDNCD